MSTCQALVQTQPGPKNKHLLSLSSSRIYGLKVIANFGVGQCSKFLAAPCHCVAPCPCFASCNCCHDQFIVRSAQTCPPFNGFPQLACIRLDVHADNCLFLCSCFPLGLGVHFGSAALHQIHNKLVSLHLVVECGIHGQLNTNPANLQCCCSTEAETGFVPTSAQFLAVSTFLVLRFPSWTRSCIQKHRVSMCFVRCPAPNRSVKEFAVELPLCISVFIGIPRSWYIDLKDSPT